MRPGRRAIVYAQSEPSTISASTLPTVMIRLFTSDASERRVVPRGC